MVTVRYVILDDEIQQKIVHLEELRGSLPY